MGRTNAGDGKAHLKILCAVSPSFGLHRFGKLEDIQAPAFLSAHTGLDDCAASFIPPATWRSHGMACLKHPKVLRFFFA